jgi:hypothetical protein
MNDARAQRLERATTAWREWCAALEQVGSAALANTLTDEEIDFAEGLRHLTRMARLTLAGGMENNDPLHPFFDRSLGQTLKMGGDNPAGLYLSAPINGTDTYRVAGTRGSATWISFMAQRHHGCFAAGLGVFGDAIFTDLEVQADDTFELVLSPHKQSGNWIETDRFSARLMVRQFFGEWSDVRPMDLTIENLTRGGEPKEFLSLSSAVEDLARSTQSLQTLVPAMQSELAAKGDSINTFAADIGDATESYGGVPGGNAVTMRWRLAADEALVATVRPPTPCAYWDVQLGNIWYESWDYRHFLSGIVHTQATHRDDGSATIVLSERDPGTTNWVQTCGHREGHLAVRWQLTDGQLPLPECAVVKVGDVKAITGLPLVSDGERRTQYRDLQAAAERRFRL